MNRRWKLSSGGEEVTSSSDEVEDKLERERFSQKYQEMHRLVREPDGSTVLYIGAENWPFPIPLVSKNGAWYFDSDTGKEEILFRTIGENETTAIQVCHVLAQGKERSETETVAADPVIQYAQASSVAVLRMPTRRLAIRATSRLLFTGTTFEQ